MTNGPSFMEENARSFDRMRAIAQHLGDEALGTHVSEEWTVADVLVHIAFWDARVQFLVAKLQRGEPFTADDIEPEDVSWINDAVWRLLNPIEPRAAADLALSIAMETDELVASIPSDQMYPLEPTSLINPFRSTHRSEHLDEIEASFPAGS